MENYPDVYLKVLRLLLCVLKGEAHNFSSLIWTTRKEKIICRLISLKVYLINFCGSHCDFCIIFLDKGVSLGLDYQTHIFL